jgi:hypothetical protein
MLPRAPLYTYYLLQKKSRNILRAFQRQVDIEKFNQYAQLPVKATANGSLPKAHISNDSKEKVIKLMIILPLY